MSDFNMADGDLSVLERAARNSEEATNDPAANNYWARTDHVFHALATPATVLWLIARARRAEELERCLSADADEQDPISDMERDRMENPLS